MEAITVEAFLMRQEGGNKKKKYGHHLKRVKIITFQDRHISSSVKPKFSFL